MEDISLHILDVAENSVKAGARRVEIEIVEDAGRGTLELVISDNGEGMDPEFAKRALDPFTTTRTTRPVGLGLSLLAQAAQDTGGSVKVDSAPGRGTKVTAAFDTSHIDMKPLGDLVKTLEALVIGNPEVEFAFRFVSGEEEETFDTGRRGSAPGS